jgi:hypothetical protein
MLQTVSNSPAAKARSAIKLKEFELEGKGHSLPCPVLDHTVNVPEC